MERDGFQLPFRREVYVPSRRDVIIGSILACVLGIAVAMFLGIAFTLAFLVKPTHAQHNHDRGHADYQNWSSTKTGACCNNQDCGEVAADDVRDTPEGNEIKIDGQWCPVLREHYLIRGKSPDWNTAHACITSKTDYYRDKSPCERLLCFVSRGGV